MADATRLVQQHVQTVTPYDTQKTALLVQQHVQTVTPTEPKTALLIQQHVQVISRVPLPDPRLGSYQVYDITVDRVEEES
jgi:hypothetical protein